MIFTTTKIETDLNLLHEAIYSFFEQLPEANEFADIDFPIWLKEDFNGTHLFQKLAEIFNSFQALEYPVIQRGLISIFRMNNEIEKVCKREICATYIEKDILQKYFDDYSPGLINLISDLFSSLYSNYLNRDKFNLRLNQNIRDHIRSFNKINGRICSFCGLDSNMVIDGQSRPALDHWLPSSKFPFSAINFNNLIPACEKCNERKDAINILEDKYSKKGIGYYPYINAGGVKPVFRFIKPPDRPERLESENLDISVEAENHLDYDLFSAWHKVFNIGQRYQSYVTEIFRDWEDEYETFISGSEEMNHATNITDFKKNIQRFKERYLLRFNPGAIIYHSICNYILEEADDIYLLGLQKRFMD